LDIANSAGLVLSTTSAANAQYLSTLQSNGENDFAAVFEAAK
jgi:hypothetical protein